MSELDADELINWMAYEMTCDGKTREKLEKELSLQKSSEMGSEQRAAAIREMFKSLGGK
jgi:hypothetical protein